MPPVIKYKINSNMTTTVKCVSKLENGNKVDICSEINSNNF